MKRLPLCLLALLLNLTAWAADIYVAPNGSDINDGSKNAPLATVAAALRKARELRRLLAKGETETIRIILSGGIYNLFEPLYIRPEDAGTADGPTTIQAAPGEQPILSGGINITNWKKTKGVAGMNAKVIGNVWEASVPALAMGEIRQLAFRQLWVNGVKATRAKNTAGDSMDRIVSWDKKDAACWVRGTRLPLLAGNNTVEMFIHQWWAIAVLRIKKMEMHGDSTKLFFMQPESKIQNEHPWPAPWINKETGNSAFYLTNDIAFLDEPGEWYLDMDAHKIYYWPRSNEDLSTANVVAPLLETLVQVQGSADAPVSNISFNGIAFMYTGWLRPGQQGHVPHQAGMYMTEAYKLKPAGTPDKKTLENQAWIGRPAAAVEINFANNIHFENCRFEHLASTGLDYNTGVQDNRIKGNLFKDIGGTALLAGVFADAATEIHLPYNPKDTREVCDKLLISNNLITDAANEDWSCVGIGLGYTKNSIVEHNEVENVSYTGISMGWGWSPTANAMKNNFIVANKVHHYGKHNYDCAGIYTLSAQPNSWIVENYVDSIYKAPYAHLPSHWFYLYTDEGSSYFTVKDNWTPSQKYLQNANGPGNQWINNGPMVKEKIKLNAGLQSNFQFLAAEKTAPHYLPINTEHSEVIELITKAGDTLDVKKLQAFLRENKMDTTAVYQWKNHYVIFDKLKDALAFKGKLQAAFPQAEVKWYADMFYEFNRSRCDDKNVAKEWDHILLTCNLVADKKMQDEYLNYHATQFEKWPELSKGFCNASFQQLLIFRNGRQLVLVISIPKGESLDKLNPKTMEGNPRVVEWNKMMAKYQEGIEGTKKGESWVFLSPLAP
ncbi:L-rhamnose mutarotase [Ferruginibacter sp.]